MTPRSLPLVLASAALAVAFHGAFGCRQIAGVEDREPPRSCSASAPGSESCSACLSTACCDELEACGDDPACTGEGKLSELAVELRVCRATSCAEACELECGGAGVPVVGCQECGRACCASAEECARSRACGLLEVCQAACGSNDVACREACVNAHPQGASLSRAIDDCVAASCDQVADWSCIGAVDWFTPTEPEIPIRLYLLDNATDAPLGGLEVRGCYGSDVDCTSPFVLKETTQFGEVVVDRPVSPPGSYVAYGGGEYLQHQRFFFPPPSIFQRFDLPVVRVDDFADLYAASGWTLEPGRGSLWITIVDCKGLPAAGVTLSASTADELTKIVYPSAAQLDLGATDESGQVMLINLPAGSTALTATVTSLCKDSGTIALRVSDGGLGLSELPPTP